MTVAKLVIHTRAARKSCEAKKSTKSNIGGGPIAQRLRASIIARGVPERHVNSTLARDCGISHQTVFNWFSGRTRIPRADHLAQLASVYDIDLMWLILGEQSESG